MTVLYRFVMLWRTGVYASVEQMLIGAVLWMSEDRRHLHEELARIAEHLPRRPQRDFAAEFKAIFENKIDAPLIAQRSVQS